MNVNISFTSPTTFWNHASIFNFCFAFESCDSFNIKQIIFLLQVHTLFRYARKVFITFLFFSLKYFSSGKYILMLIICNRFETRKVIIHKVLVITILEARRGSMCITDPILIRILGFHLKITFFHI